MILYIKMLLRVNLTFSLYILVKKPSQKWVYAFLGGAWFSTNKHLLLWFDIAFHREIIHFMVVKMVVSAVFVGFELCCHFMLTLNCFRFIINELLHSSTVYFRFNHS